MKVEIAWGLLCLVCGLLAGRSDGKPFDADSIKESMQMAALNAAGMAMEMADNMKPSALIKGEFGFGGQASDSSEEDRRRRRRSTGDEDLTALQTREKRSPCGRRRRMQSTAAPGATTTAADTEDIPRRRRRSPAENDIDENGDVIPSPMEFEQSAQELSEKIRQAIRTAIEGMGSVFEAIGKNIQKAFAKEAQDSEAV